MKNIERRGLDFVRVAIAKAISEGSVRECQRYAEARWGISSNAALVLKGAVAAATTGDNTWAAPLVQAVGSEFFELVMERSLPGRMAGLRRVPLAERVVVQSGGAQASWVGEGKATPIMSGAFSPPVTLPALKIVAINVQTVELTRLADPAAEALLRDDLVASVSEGIDGTFADPAMAATGVSPASISNGAPSVVASNYLGESLKELIAVFDGDLERAHFLGNPETLTLFSGADRPNVGARGGEMLGIPTLASRKVPVDDLILVDAGRIAFASGDTEVSISREGTIQMNDAPDSPVTASTTLVSLWQQNLVAFKALQFANWSAASGAVAYLTGLSNLGDSP